jgi:hypothetical protein
MTRALLIVGVIYLSYFILSEIAEAGRRVSFLSEPTDWFWPWFYRVFAPMLIMEGIMIIYIFLV